MQINIIFFECIFIHHLCALIALIFRATFCIETLKFLVPSVFLSSFFFFGSNSNLYCDARDKPYCVPPTPTHPPSLTFSKQPNIKQDAPILYRKRKSTLPLISYSLHILVPYANSFCVCLPAKEHSILVSYLPD